MTLDAITNGFRVWLGDVLNNDWLSTLITILLILAVTAFCAHLITRLIKKLLHVDKNPLPASSIFVNIARGTVWAVGVCVILSSCFNVNISAAITALGIGGIAVSLGFQDTLANLIAGLQVSLTKLVIPGDHIRIGSSEGVVDDVTWRHTRIITPRGERIIIPNSLMNTDALVKLPPRSLIRVNLIIPQTDIPMSQLLQEMESQVDKAVKAITVLTDHAKIDLSEVTERGYRGTLAFSVMEGANVGQVKTAALKAISDHASRMGKPRKRRRHIKYVKAPKGLIQLVKKRFQGARS